MTEQYFHLKTGSEIKKFSQRGIGKPSDETIQIARDVEEYPHA